MSEEGNVTPLKPEESPAERAVKIMAENVELRDVGGSLQRIAAELARHNALQAEGLRLQQMQIQLISGVVDLLRGQLSNGPQVQMKMLEQFGTMFAPIMAMMNERAAKPAQIHAEPVVREPVARTGPGFSVTGDPNEATPREE